MSTEDYILATFSNIFQILVVWRFVRIFFFPRVEKWEEMVGYIGYLVFSLAVFFGFQSPLCNMVTSWGGLLLLTVVMYEGTWKKKPLIATLIWTVHVMCDAVASYLFYDYMGGDMIPQYIGIFTALFLFISQIVVEKFMGDRGKGDLNHSHIILLGVTAVSAVMLGVLVVTDLNHRVLLVVEGCGGICINLLIFFIYHRMAQEYEERIKKEHMEEQVRMYQNQLELMQISQEKVRSLRHDMRHHLQVLYGMEEKGQHEKILQFLEDMQVSLENPKKHIVSGNDEIDTILNYNWDRAEQLGVKIDCKVSISKKLSIPAYDSSVLLGNLLGNAIEAAARMKDGYVSVRILAEKNVLALQVKNNYNGVLKKRGEQFISTKEEKGHGLGLRNVRELVEKRQGSFQIDYDEKEFRVEVVIYV